MEEPYIDLMLKPGTQQEPVKHINEETNGITFEKAIEQSQVTVILGVPGSGKTTLLKHYYRGHLNDSVYYTVHEWLDVDDTELNNEISCILIDGFDELRIDGRNCNAINKVVRIMMNYVDKIHKFVLSCRAMDWFENQDRNALEKAIHSVSVFYIQPLTEHQIKELIHQLINDSKAEYAFLNTYSQFDFLNNPEMVNLLVNIYTNHPDNIPKSKKEVYKRYIALSNRYVDDSDYRNDTPTMDDDQIFKYAGYLAYFYLISSCNNGESPSCNDNKINYSSKDFFKDIASSEHGYPISSLENVCKTKIFNKERQIVFQHRTIAEFLCAHFLYYELSKNKNLSLRRIFGLLLLPDGKRVRSELRGVYAWLCAFSEDEQYYKIDPYNQLLYGDNSHFSLKNKQSVLKAIREFSQTEPYFLKMDWYRTPKYFYTSELDEFLIQEYCDTWDKPNHYSILLSDLMLNAEDNPSQKLENFAIEAVSQDNLPTHYKNHFVRLLKNNQVALKSLLDRIECNKITDDGNQLLDNLLSYLYPQTIGPEDILEHIKKYKPTEEHYSDFYYLFTDLVSYSDLKQLILKIIHEYTEGKLFGQFASQIDNFMAYYWCKAIHNESPKNMLELLELSLTHNWILAKKSWRIAFNSGELWYRAHGITLEITELIKDNIYSAWLDRLQKFKSEHAFDKMSWYIKDCVSLLMPNEDKQIEILKSRLSKDNSNNFNLLLLTMMQSLLSPLISKHGNQECINILELASEFGIREEYESLLKPSPAEEALHEKWQLERDKVLSEIEASIQKNDSAFASMSLDEKENAWGYLMGIIPYYLEDRREQPNNPFNPNRLKISEKTYDELLDILKPKLTLACSERPYVKYTSISSLAQNSPSASRNVDHLYYAITCLNNENAYRILTDKGFIEYLYVVNLVLGEAAYIRKNDFCNWFESSNNKSFKYAIGDAQNCILEFIQCILQSSDNFCEQVVSYLSNDVKELPALKKLLSFPSFSSHRDYEECLLKNIVEQFNCQIPIKLLEAISEFSSNGTELNNECTVLMKFADSSSSLTLNEVVELHSLLSPFHHFGFTHLDCEQKHRITSILLNTFNKSEMLQFHSGFQSPFDECADFVNRTLWDSMNAPCWLSILEDLLKNHENDIWTNRIKHQIYQLQSFSDDEMASKSIQKAKDFIFDTGYATPRDLWLDVCEKLYSINNDIQTNDSNHVNAFYNFKDHECKHKSERDCRDILFNIWNFTHSNKILAEPIREYYVGNDKRVDFTLRSRNKISNEDYCVHIECKVDDNRAIKFGIPEQLIKFYLKNNPNNYGVYFVFCFKRNPDKLKEILKLTIPPGYTDRIEVICLDLRKV